MSEESRVPAPWYYPGAQNCKEELAVGARIAVVYPALATISLETGVILWLCVQRRAREDSMMWEGREVITFSKMGDKGMEDARGVPATATHPWDVSMFTLPPFLCPFQVQA